MDRAAFTAMTGAKYAVDLLSVTSNNLANAGTAGFREQLAFFRSVPLEGEGAPTRTFAMGWTPFAKLSEGVMEPTGVPTNAAIDGPGWFVVLRRDGNQGLTRSGAFRVIEGKLCLTDGVPVVSSVGGSISVPGGAEVDISDDGNVNAKFATNPVTTQLLGRLKVVNPPKNTLLRDGDGFFVTLDKRVEQLVEDPTIKVRGRYLETSNVNSANALLQIIVDSRAFDMNMKMVQTVSENDKAANSLISRAR
jgi:flagellar basal-body rod protein FlgF